MVVVTIKIIIREKVYSRSFRIFQFFPLEGGGIQGFFTKGKGEETGGVFEKYFHVNLGDLASRLKKDPFPI
jgi:hypothetical protein